MKRDEAKHILELIRPAHEGDRDDPLVREALELLDNDPELREWFEAANGTDQRISRSLGAIPVPADLKSSILAGMRMHEESGAAEAPNAETVVARTTQSWWRQPWVAVAACLVLVLGIVSQIDRSPAGDGARNEAALAGVPGFVRFLSEEMDDFPGFDRTSRDAGELRTFLASRGDPAPRVFPGKLSEARSLGCVTFSYEGTKFSMICFKGSEVFHLITADASTFDEVPPSTPQFFECNGQTFRVWTEGDQVLILSVKGSKEKISEII